MITQISSKKVTSSSSPRPEKFLKKFLYWTEQFLILMAHLLLLGWILYALYYGGTLTSMDIFWHFLGMAVYGALLIRLCAFLAHRRFLKENGSEAKDSREIPMETTKDEAKVES